ncbi:ketopantoate reductase family protein [Paenibacillus sanfengchensis]|uniref:ketopantoate reductase family protein n=1 Tax=Paenibacillus sanfengchensis TaxID=3119819 RepID=UPI002FE0F972
MKVLIYGAGVLGSYLAHALIRGGNDVSVLARGRRADELEKDGLVIRHYFQLKTSVDSVRVVRTLEPDDIYDLIFVVMKFNDFPSVLPVLARSRSGNIVIVGNNPGARDMQIYLAEHSSTRKNVAFGFQLSAGRREPGGLVVSVRGGVQLVIGGLDGPIPFRAMLDQAFAKTNYKPVYHDDIDAWLKNHIIPILAINYGTLIHDGKMKKIAGDNKLLRQMVAAMDEGFSVLEALGYPLVPAGQAKWIRNHPALLRLLLKIFHLLPVSRMIDGSPHEIVALSRVFGEWKNRAGIPTPNWDMLEERISAAKQ